MQSARDTGATRPDTITDPKRLSGALPNPAQPDPGQREPSQKSKADREHTTPCRGLLAGMLAALLTGAAATVTARAVSVPAAGEDAELLASCAEFRRLHETLRSWPHYDGDEDVYEAVMDERWDASDDVMALSAATDEGRRAKAAVALDLLEENYGDGEGSGWTMETAIAVSAT